MCTDNIRGWTQLILSSRPFEVVAPVVFFIPVLFLGKKKKKAILKIYGMSFVLFES